MLRVAVVLLCGLALASAESVTASGSYTAPEPAAPEYQAPAADYPSQQYEMPAQQYAAPAQQYGAPAQQYAAPQPTPVVQYIQSHTGYDEYQDDDSLFMKSGGSILHKFGLDFAFTGLMVAAMVVVLAIVGLVTVPSLPFTSNLLPSVTKLFEARSLGGAASLASSLLDGQFSTLDLARAAGYAEQAIDRARRFIADFQE